MFEFVTHPDDGPYVRWTYRLEPSGTGTRVTEIWEVEQLSPGRRNQTQAQLDERSRYTETMLEQTLAAIKRRPRAERLSARVLWLVIVWHDSTGYGQEDGNHPGGVRLALPLSVC